MLRRVLRWLGIGTLVVGYPLLAHYTNNSAQGSHLGKWVAIAPVILIALVLAWRSPRRWALLGVLVLFCVALWAARSTLDQHVGLVYWLEHMTMQIILLVTFGRTLFGGREPLCTYFARTMHGPLTPQHEAYSRQITAAWSLFFATVALTSTLLFFLAPLATWSFFANFLNLPLVVLMFVGEYAVRKRVLPEREHSILDAIRAMKRARTNPQ